MDLEDVEQDQRRATLKSWVESHGGHAAVVRRHRLTLSQASYLSQVLNGYSFGTRAARRMELRLGLQPHALDGRDSTLDSPAMFLRTAPAPPHKVGEPPGPWTTALPVVLWHDIDANSSLPAEFITEMPDDALAPNVPRSTPMIFATGHHATPGQAVLVVDATEKAYIRRYAEGPAGTWLAQALNPAFLTLDSARDGLCLRAVLQGRMSGFV